MERRARPALPTGWRRALARVPVLLYRVRLGWLLGSRFVLIHHIGRSTGLPRTAVVEVVDHDADTGTWTVASGFGSRRSGTATCWQRRRCTSRSDIAGWP